jgi:hypothetical protein
MSPELCARITELQEATRLAFETCGLKLDAQRRSSAA